MLQHNAKSYWVSKTAGELKVVGPGRFMGYTYVEILDEFFCHQRGPWCSPSWSHFISSRITAPSMRAVTWRGGFGNTLRLCCTTSIHIARSQSHWEWWAALGLQFPQYHSYKQSLGVGERQLSLLGIPISSWRNKDPFFFANVHMSLFNQVWMQLIHPKTCLHTVACK